MDAISFVLGVNSNQLRSSHLVDLINRRSDAEIAKSTAAASNSNKKRAVVKEKGAQKTTVSAFYSRNDNEELVFSRRYISIYAFLNF